MGVGGKKDEKKNYWNYGMCDFDSGCCFASVREL